MGAGLAGSMLQKQPKYNMDSMNQALDLINKQYTNVNDYFKTAGQDLETQFGSMKSQTMTDAINSLASTGVYDSPVSEYGLNRTRKGLAETYATAKSSLAGQQMQAVSAIDSQKINYYQNLAGMQYQQALAKQQGKNQIFGSIASLGAALI